MAKVGEEDVEYESDPEEAKQSLKMRRREASDDEEEEEEQKSEDRDRRDNPPRRIESDGESEEQGAAADYDEEEDLEEEDLEEYLEEEEEDEDVYEDGGGVGGIAHEGGVSEAEGVPKDADGAEEAVGQGTGLAPRVDDGDELNLQGEEEKKENEPYAVPTAGAFYMHDDRFGDNVAGRNRRTFGGRKLWESKDDRKWGHDKFEELTTEERHYEEDRRISRGRYRGRGRIQGADSGASRGRRPKAFINGGNQTNNNNQKIQNNASKGIRGRGPRRYRPSFKDNVDAPPPLNKQSGQSVGKPSLNSTDKASVPRSDIETDSVTAAKQGFVSSLNFASPPFYPSSSSTKETTMTNKRGLQHGTSSRSVQPSLLGESSATVQSTAMSRGKDVSNSIGIGKLNIDESISTVAGKPSSSLQFPPGSLSTNSTQSQPLRGQGRGFNASPHMNYQSLPNNQANRVSLPTQPHSTHRNTVQSRGQHSLQVTGQQFAQRSSTGSQVLSPPKTGQLVNSSEPGELESSSESSKSKSAMVAKGKGTLQGVGRGSVIHGGAQVMGAPGNMGSGHGDRNFSPAFLPVMQFGGQHPRGMGVPAVGMAFPGYVGQPQLGLGNSEMTWLPVLAGAAGALGATYCSPYITVDGAYHARPSGQMSSLTAAPSSQENSTSKPNSEWKPQRGPELTNDDLGQRQKNPRRYTEMKFDQ